MSLVVTRLPVTSDVSPRTTHNCPIPWLIGGREPVGAGERSQMLALLGPASSLKSLLQDTRPGLLLLLLLLLLQLSFHSVAVVLIPVQTKQVRIITRKPNNTKTRYKQYKTQ
jgi:hypothetical protein